MLNPTLTNAAPLRRTVQLCVQQVGVESLVYDEREHQAYCLNQIAALVWRLCDGATTPQGIADAAGRELGTPLGEQSVLLALDELERHGLLSSKPEHALPPVLTRRVLASRLGAGALLMVPVVALIAAPTAAQAYNGCVDCVSPKSAARRRAQSGGDEQ